MLLVAIPTLIARFGGVVRGRRQPRNLFVYLLLRFLWRPSPRWWSCCSRLGVVWIDGFSRCRPGWRTSAGYLWLIMFPEVFINGTVITGLVVYYPEWLETFNRIALPAGALEGRRA